MKTEYKQVGGYTVYYSNFWGRWILERGIYERIEVTNAYSHRNAYEIAMGIAEGKNSTIHVCRPLALPI